MWFRCLFCWKEYGCYDRIGDMLGDEKMNLKDRAKKLKMDIPILIFKWIGKMEES